MTRQLPKIAMSATIHDVGQIHEGTLPNMYAFFECVQFGIATLTGATGRKIDVATMVDAATDTMTVKLNWADTHDAAMTIIGNKIRPGV